MGRARCIDISSFVLVSALGLSLLACSQSPSHTVPALEVSVSSDTPDDAPESADTASRSQSRPEQREGESDASYENRLAAHTLLDRPGFKRIIVEALQRLCVHSGWDAEVAWSPQTQADIMYAVEDSTDWAIQELTQILDDLPEEQSGRMRTIIYLRLAGYMYEEDAMIIHQIVALWASEALDRWFDAFDQAQSQ